MYPGAGTPQPHTRLAIVAITVPDGANLVAFGCGPAGGKGFSPASPEVVGGARFGASEVTFSGAAERLSPSVSAYAMFEPLPALVYFGPVATAMGIPGPDEIEALRLCAE